MILFRISKPLDIIERSCRKHGSSFLGRKEGTKELTHITHKAPIAISPADQLYFFPTYSYSRKECAWLSHFYIESNKELKDGNLIIRFINGFAVKLEISKLVLKINKIVQRNYVLNMKIVGKTRESLF